MPVLHVHQDKTLLPADIFTDLLRDTSSDAGKTSPADREAIPAMQQRGGEYGDHDIAWFDGGLFKTIDVPQLTASTICAKPGSTRPSGSIGSSHRKRKKPASRNARSAKPGHEADLKKRTLTNLYNARPTWLDLAHKALDQAVATAYGWTDYTPEMPDDEILRRLLALNLERSKPDHVE